MKTDSIFYRIFLETPGIFFELIGNSPDTATNYKFDSVEVKQTAFRIDGVFCPQQNPQIPFYFLEVQFQPDTELYSRLFSEVFLYLHKSKPANPWRGVVIYPNRSIDTGDIKNYEEFFASQRVRRIYLDELPEMSALPVGIATMKLIVEEEDRRTIEVASQLIRE
jgi:predicted transposase/invertase (TIGR01784 family)